MLILVEKNKEIIAQSALEKEAENDAFSDFIKKQADVEIDKIAIVIHAQVDKEIDCTTCGACCKNLMINVMPDEASNVSKHLNISNEDFNTKFVEISTEGKMIINTIPCHFLNDKKCTIYEQRFSGCREFPHLDKPNFKGRIFSTLMYYAICPIIYNVVEELKIQTGFIQPEKK